MSRPPGMDGAGVNARPFGDFSHAHEVDEELAGKGRVATRAHRLQLGSVPFKDCKIGETA